MVCSVVVMLWLNHADVLVPAYMSNLSIYPGWLSYPAEPNAAQGS